MNELMKVKDLRGTTTSKWIAEVTNKRHDNVIRDIEDEMNKLGKKGELIFEVTFIKNKSGRVDKMYNLNAKGVLQIAARYDAVVRYQLIEKVFENIDSYKPKNIIDTKSLPYKSIKLFINDCVEDSQYDITSLTLYEYYITYCVKNKLNFTSRNVFLREFRKEYKHKYYKKIMFEGIAYRGYRNLEVNENKLLTI